VKILWGSYSWLQPAFSRLSRAVGAPRRSRLKGSCGPEGPPHKKVQVRWWGGLLIALWCLSVPAFAADQAQADHGRAVYQKWCTPCHGTGPGKAGTEAAAAHGIKPAVLEERTNLSPKVIESVVRNGISFMPRFRKTEISNADLDAIVAYLVHK